MKQVEKIARVYVALNCLLDTRLGTLLAIDETFALDVIGSKEYYTRMQDVFSTPAAGVLSKELFQKVYNRDKDALIPLSLRTKMFAFVHQICKELTLKAIAEPTHTGVEVVINTYPHHFTDDAAQDLLKAFIALLGDTFSISIVHYSNEELTPSFCRANYLAMILYEYADWLNIHEASIKKKPMRDIALYVPRLCFSALPTKEQMDELESNGTDFFTFSKQLLDTVINIQFCPIALYCAAVPDNKPEYLTARAF